MERQGITDKDEQDAAIKKYEASISDCCDNKSGDVASVGMNVQKLGDGIVYVGDVKCLKMDSKTNWYIHDYIHFVIIP